MRVPALRIRQQLLAILRAWGMSGAHEIAAEMMLMADADA